MKLGVRVITEDPDEMDRLMKEAHMGRGRTYRKRMPEYGYGVYRVTKILDTVKDFDMPVVIP